MRQALAIALLFGCGSSQAPDGGVRDAISADTGGQGADAAVSDSAPTDSSVADSGTSDAGTTRLEVDVNNPMSCDSVCSAVGLVCYPDHDWLGGGGLLGGGLLEYNNRACVYPVACDTVPQAMDCGGSLTRFRCACR